MKYPVYNSLFSNITLMLKLFNSITVFIWVLMVFISVPFKFDIPSPDDLVSSGLSSVKKTRGNTFDVSVEK